MGNKLWKKFGQLTGKCYVSMVGMSKKGECWQETFRILQDIVADGRTENAGYAKELYLLDEETDYEYDVQGWLEDYLDELDMREEREALLRSVEWLLKNFAWEEESPSDLYFRKVMLLLDMEKYGQAEEFCRKWRKKEPDNMQAAAACIYAGIAMGKTDEAKQLAETYISKDTECTDENDILFVAAEKLYEKVNDKQALKRVRRAEKTYEDRLEKEWFAAMDEEDDYDYEDEDDGWPLPFS